jgi:prepilin-type N-terminal cleavage/methylation domain-containing protein
MKRLAGKKGFTLVECIAAVMVFAVLMLAVGTMISTSLAISAMFMQNGRAWQDQANNVMRGIGTPETGIITIAGGGINVTIPVTVRSNETFTGFFPP